MAINSLKLCMFILFSTHAVLTKGRQNILDLTKFGIQEKQVMPYSGEWIRFV